MLKLRSIILFISKAVAIIFCVYYIINAKDYHVSWSLFDSLMPTYIVKINNLLSSIGTYILVIPLTIILGSILISESTKLHIISSLFGIMSILITAIKGIATNSVTEVTNFRLFKVSHVLSIEQKYDIFTTECNRIITEKYLGVIKLHTYLVSKLNGDMIAYHKVLENLNLPSQIKQYAQALILDLVAEFHKQSIPYFQISGKHVIYVVCGVITIFVGSAIANELVTDWGPTIKDIISGFQNINKISSNVTTQLINLTALAKEHALGIARSTTGLIILNERVDAQDTKIDLILEQITKK
jgi:hypothetical protein